MTLADYINNFLRDAQLRVAQLSVEIYELKDDGSYQYRDKAQQRLHLVMLMDILYEGKWYITDGYNHVQFGATDETWTENDLIQEIEYWRYHTNMDEAPYINFTPHYPLIASSTGGSVSANGLPTGLPGQVIFYNASGSPYADDIDPYGGYIDGQTIGSYFNNRE